jgi:Ca2+-binding RTX toxin-like protein
VADISGDDHPCSGNTITVGDGEGDSVSLDGYFSATNNTIIVGNGANDGVSVLGYSHGSIKVGDGDKDVVSLGTGNNHNGTSNSKITLGNGNGDVVNSNYNYFGGNNTITVGNGNGDVVNDSGSNDMITLGNGNGDVVNASGSNNTITLGNGSDTVTAVSSLINGGHGHDTFVFTGSFGQDTITNFNPLHDNIVLAQAMFGNFGAMQADGDIRQVGLNTVITNNPADPVNAITLTNVNASSLHAGDFKFV